MGKAEAAVNLLSAEVRTLMIGARQVTLTVWKQLDHAHPEKITPFGRVSPGRDYTDSWMSYGPKIWIVGKDTVTWALVRSSLPLTDLGQREFLKENEDWTEKELKERVARWQALDLIVLAGLR